MSTSHNLSGPQSTPLENGRELMQNERTWKLSYKWLLEAWEWPRVVMGCKLGWGLVTRGGYDWHLAGLARDSSVPTAVCGWLTDLSQRAGSILLLPHREAALKKLKSILCVIDTYWVLTLCRAPWEGSSASLLSRNLTQLERHICVSPDSDTRLHKLAKLKVASKEVKRGEHGLWSPFCRPPWLSGLGQVT